MRGFSQEAIAKMLYICNVVMIVHCILALPIFGLFYICSHAEFSQNPIDHGAVTGNAFIVCMIFFAFHFILALRPKVQAFILVLMLPLCGFAGWNTYLGGAYVYNYYLEYKNLVEAIDEAQLLSMLAKEEKRLNIFFISPDCPSCDNMLPKIEKYAKGYFDKLYVVDATKLSQPTLERFSIEEAPSLFTIRGEVAKVYAGDEVYTFLDKDALLSA